MRWEALQALCSAPPSDVLSCENGSSLHKQLGAALADPDLSVSPDLITGFTKDLTAQGLMLSVVIIYVFAFVLLRSTIFRKHI